MLLPRSLECLRKGPGGLAGRRTTARDAILAPALASRVFLLFAALQGVAKLLRSLEDHSSTSGSDPRDEGIQQGATCCVWRIQQGLLLPLCCHFEGPCMHILLSNQSKASLFPAPDYINRAHEALTVKRALPPLALSTPST
jgi:hypothetical protein